jgi:hypothetical protein
MRQALPVHGRGLPQICLQTALSKLAMDAPFMDLGMESRSIAPSSLVDPGLRRDDGGFWFE